MAGLVPATHVFTASMLSYADADANERMGLYYNESANGTLYVGCTVDLGHRVWEQREGVVGGFTKQYGLKRLVYAEHHADVLTAKQREMNMKHWPRAWKVRLIHRDNPDWDELYDRLF